MSHNNKSDYTKAFMDLVHLLPEPYQSDTNISLFSNLFNRYLSKQEVDKVAGYIGKGNSSAIVKRQIKEKDVHRQAFQLQPILYDKIGSIEHMASWKDIQHELERLGVDLEDFANWGATQKFNWAPPIDINKIINYRDYYWDSETNELPQYITVRNKCSTATSRVTWWESIMNQYGDTFPLVEMLPADNINSLPSYTISNIDFSGNEISVIGDATSSLSENEYFTIEGTAYNNGAHQVNSLPVYDGVNNLTIFTVNDLVTNENSIGTLKLRRFDKIVIGSNYTLTYEGSPEVVTSSGLESGDYSELFKEGFIIFIRNLANLELNNSYIEIVSSEADIDNLQTIITIKNAVTDNTVLGGELSLNEQYSVYIAEKNCQCGILGGWDEGNLWDDNPNIPLWGDVIDSFGNPVSDGISDHTNFIDSITNAGPPVGAGSQDELWHDSTNNRLYQYDTTIGWKILWNNFNLLLDATTGFALWDLTEACDIRPRIEAMDQWISQNKWVHKNDITNYASVRRATQPIIEYDWDLELNEWTRILYNWSYRSEVDDIFSATDIKPPSIEIAPITWWELESSVDINNKTVIFDTRYGDLTDYFVAGKQVYISNGTSPTIYTVDYSEYKSSPSTHPYRTFVTFTVKPNSTGDLINLIPNTYEIYPFKTVMDDVWQGYGVHWLFLGADDATPAPHQVDNPYIAISDSATPILGYDGGSPQSEVYEYTTSAYQQKYFVTKVGSPGNSWSTFYLTDSIEVGHTRPLNRQALYGFDDIRVYLTNAAGTDIERQFGTYDELGEVVLDIISIDYDTNEFIVDGNYSQYFNTGDTIRVSGNSNFGTMDFQVIPPTVPNSNRIRVSGSPGIPPGATISGDISNITSPIQPDADPDFSSNKNGITVYVVGIEFFNPVDAGLNVAIEVGASSIDELGSHLNKVRMVESDETYDLVGDSAISLINYRKVEQIKTRTNQYPLFDIFNVDGTPAYKANPIFGYRTSSEYEINVNTGFRIVYDSVNDIYEFDQFLLEEDDGVLYAYRDYANKEEDYWYNPDTQVVYFWRGVEWSDKTEMSEHYTKAIVSEVEPDSRLRAIDGLYWYNPVLDKLYRRFVSGNIWVEIEKFDNYVTDINLQTIWKGGLNDEMYIPEKVDWDVRSLEEYNTEKDDYITARAAELILKGTYTIEAEAITQATQEWFQSQINHLSSTGTWIGDWEIPDPLYYNHLHENRKYLNSRELLTHFSTIIEEQPLIPGYTGSKDGMFNLLPINDVNYGYGGTIKEFNYGFDNLLSSIFIDTVTPRTLIEFAHDQYEKLLNSVKEIYRENAISLLTNLEIANILDLSSYVATNVITEHELNDQASFVYGDSTTFIDVEGSNDIGIRNWIATLPYINLVNAMTPNRIVDDNLSLNDVVHHDGHRHSYKLTQATKDIISQLVVSSPDPRTIDRGIGVTSSMSPPDNISEFLTSFDAISNREGVYWYQIKSGEPNILYRYIVAESGEDQPSSSLPDGTLWMDLTPSLEVLRIKETDYQGNVEWNEVTGLLLGGGRLHNGTDPNDVTTATISAWQEVNLDTLLGDTIYEIETRLYDNVPTFPNLAYDFEQLANDNPVKYQQYLEEAFLDYVSQNEITSPYKNTEYNASDAFTWNYKNSSIGGGLTILEADGLTNSFLVAGDYVATFDPCTDSGACNSQITFYIKNSSVNDGTWKTLLSTPTTPTTYYDSGNDTTRIFVEGDVLDGTRGIIYSGVLPSLITISQPNNLNDGSESGGDWRDLYTKIYGTPYPHAEPWVLQGYIDKPDWWDEEYLNDDVEQWGDRKWKYKHGFDIVLSNNDGFDGQSLLGSPITYGQFGIAGDFHTNFYSGQSFTVDESVTHAGVYTIASRDDLIAINPGSAGSASFVIEDLPPDPAADIYQVGMVFSIAERTINPVYNILIKSFTIKSVSHSLNTFIITVEESIDVGEFNTTDHFINGLLYDPLTNITSIKLEQSVASDIPSGKILQAYGMWENIRIGVIPPNRTYPNGVLGMSGVPSEDTLLGLSVPDLPTFNYFSVNISNRPLSADGGTTTYNPDDVFPPYWDYITAFNGIPQNYDVLVRSLFSSYTTEVISPNASYVFGDAGNIEWEWRVSSQFLYDQLTVAFRIDPMRFSFLAFGFDLTTIGGLQVSKRIKNTASHTRVDFHGEVVDNQQYKSNGMNQWYVNYNRYSGYDANFSNFREMWTGWTAPLTYQFASFIDTPSLTFAHRYVNVSNFDYNIVAKRAPGINDYWLDALKVSITNVPYNLARYDNHIDWRFELKTNISISRNLKYYDVHNYQFYADPDTDICSLYTWEIKDLDTFNKTFTIAGDQTSTLIAGSQFDIQGSIGNDATYDIELSSYDTTTKLTTIFVSNNIPDAEISGVIKADYRTIPWETGDTIYLSTAETMPIPLATDTILGTTKYYIIRLSDTTFKVAETYNNAIAGIPIDITSAGRSDHFVGQIVSTFLADSGARSNTNWRIYALDKTNILEINTPQEIQGMQTLVNIIQGYASYLDDIGWKVNNDHTLQDPTSGKILNWQTETERFITYAYSQRVLREQLNDRYPVTVDITTDTFTFVDTNRTFITGDPVIVISSNNVFPTPLSQGIRYYVIRDTLDTFRLSATKQGAKDGIAIDILSISGVGNLSVSKPREFRASIKDFEINPFRNAIWFEPTVGIVSNVITGPSADVRSTQLIFNQNGDRISTDQLRVYRQDKLTKIEVLDAVEGETLPLISDAYTRLHLGGLHLFTDAYEHVMVLNNYTSEDNLLYDPFIGLNVTKYEMLFNRQKEFTQRPNVGGYYLSTFFNQGANLNENIEASVENLRNAYDTYRTLETNLMTEYARNGLGYEGTKDYLSNLNLSNKSQFLFWRGQIQAKGSINAVTAYINSRRFIDAKVDDYWAVKVGSFGSTGEKEYPEMFVATADARSNELRLEFIDNETNESSVENTFTAIKMSNTDRWYNQPDQTKVLRDNGKVMYFDMKIKNKWNYGNSPTDFITNNGSSYIKHDLDADFVEVTQEFVDTGTTVTLTEGTHYNIINNNIIEWLEGTGGSPNTVNNVTIWGLRYNDDAQNPARIIDREAETQISPIQFWDPARGKHYTTAIHNIDLINENDPARYGVTSQTQNYVDIWKDGFVGTTWLNTENLDYVPYYSEQMFPDRTERFRNWGNLADWSNIEIYEWVESDVPPAEWDALAAIEEGDRTIEEHLRKAGTARKILLRKVGSDWVPAVNKFVELYTAIDGVLSGNNYTFTPSLVNFDSVIEGSPETTKYYANVYINGIIYEENADITSGYVVNDAFIKEADVIRFVQFVPTNQDDIDILLAGSPETYRQEYEYTQVPYYDTLGNLFYNYYFWVTNKGTKPRDKNRTMSIAEAQVQLASIPAAHMFFQNPQAESSITAETSLVLRRELTTVTGSPPSIGGSPPAITYYTDYNIAEGTNVYVEVNGIDLISTEGHFSFTAGTNVIVINAVPGSPNFPANNDEITITYTAVDSIPQKLPNRFTQAIIRGLQGIVNADNRYTIRFTRDFTLRDNLENDSLTNGSTDLKNLHEEWKIFRREQQFNIDRWQWDKITESIIGYTLADTTIRVPSYERELYDEKYGTDTRYGLGTGQAFVNGDLALRTILAYLIDPNIDFSPINIDSFFTENSFDTADNIIAAMDEIYNNFSYTHVNRIYFSVLHDAFTTKAKYPDIFKTSMISLHGIRPFQTSGIFDD